MALLCDGCGDDISRLNHEECHIPLANGGGVDLCPDCEAALEEDDDELRADGSGEPTREELAERVADLERKVENIAAHNRRDTAPEGRR